MSVTKKLIEVSLEKYNSATISRTLNPRILADVLTTPWQYDFSGNVSLGQSYSKCGPKTTHLRVN